MGMRLNYYPSITISLAEGKAATFLIFYRILESLHDTGRETLISFHLLGHKIVESQDKR